MHTHDPFLCLFSGCFSSPARNAAAPVAAAAPRALGSCARPPCGVPKRQDDHTVSKTVISKYYNTLKIQPNSNLIHWLIHYCEQQHLLYTSSLSFDPLPLQALPLQILSLHLESLSLPQQVLAFFSLPHYTDALTPFAFSNFSTPLKEKEEPFPHEKK